MKCNIRQPVFRAQLTNSTKLICWFDRNNLCFRLWPLHTVSMTAILNFTWNSYSLNVTCYLHSKYYVKTPKNRRGYVKHMYGASKIFFKSHLLQNSTDMMTFYGPPELFIDNSTCHLFCLWLFNCTVDSRYLELQGTLWNTSRYPYFDISDLRNWGKQFIEQPPLTEWICNLTPKLEIYWKYCGKEEKLLLRSNFSSFPQYFVACW